ncbi:peptidase domain-containing ABC transporter [Candidatus Kirkpatrickella diaphorinae]|uniref:Peptidase domain-containing ABC transporter n=1 Tax=Candidatus Kirkpatrickella diaphorinae TaxID=2984322 RepID=A0ABY6GJD9_9PROT|nr:peptidase domain-containing ABC transporter [Candidatus Kirkpatrickella diaphorinae]UYH50878.1 peptidase domain-containing ABC transporter [Candidatus Kirkpatrickella diaphorinae]
MKFKALQFGLRRRMPVILQSEASECGLACLAMILSHHGHQIDLATLRRDTASFHAATTLRSLIQRAEREDLDARPLKLGLPALGRLNLPCIIHWDFNHFVVLVKVTESRITLHDPAYGKRVLSQEEFSRHFTGVAVEFSPTTRFTRRDDRHLLDIRDMLRHVPRLPLSLLALGVLSLGLEVIALINPILAQIIIDEVLVTGDQSLLWTIAVALALLLVLQGVFATFRGWSIMILSTRISVQWNFSLFSHLLKLPQEFFTRRGAGDIQSKFGSLATLQQTLTTDLIQSVIDGLMAVGMMIMIIIYARWLSLIILAFSALDFFLRLFLFNPYRDLSEELLSRNAAHQSHFLETLRGMRTIKLLALEGRRRFAWGNRLIDSFNTNLRLQRYDLFFSRSQEILWGADRVLLLVLGARMVLSAEMSIGMLIAFLSYRDQFAHRFGNLINAAFKIRNLKVQCHRLADIALTPVDPAMESFPLPSMSHVPSEKNVPVIECRNIGFRYGAEENWVFRHLNLTIPAQASFAIEGPSGCGKSTLMSVLMGLIPPEEGQIFWNGVALTPQNRQAYRARIAGVMQDDILLSGNIAENIASFDEEIDFTRVMTCAAQAQILDDIENLPMGFETRVSEMGATMSGGQRQRIIFARALYRQPDILFLDEATSHLDPTAERRIEATIDDLAVTRVIVTHRQETVARARFRFSMGADAAGVLQH